MQNENAQTLSLFSDMAAPEVRPAHSETSCRGLQHPARNKQGPSRILHGQQPAKRKKGRPRLANSDRAAREHEPYHFSHPQAAIGICECGDQKSAHQPRPDAPEIPGACTAWMCRCAGYTPLRIR